MTPRFSLSSLKDGRWHDYVVRFALGGFATVFAGLIGAEFGPAVGGVFLAFPAIFCASATLIEQNERRRKDEAHLEGTRRGREAAALDAAGASLGSIGMVAFALCFALIVTLDASLAFAVALLTWAAVALAAWWFWLLWRRLQRRGKN
jgi:hypothetical protein